MARPEHLFVFAYDVEKDSARGKIADALGESLDRVQLSVFEGRLTSAAAQQLSRRAAALMGPDDSLRVYCVTEAGRRGSFVFGAPPLAERHDFFLL